MPGPLISKAQSGRVNIRSTQQIGRTWTEHYLINTRSVNGRALLAFVDNVWRNGTTFTIDHRDHVTPLGTGGGSPLVNSTQVVVNPQNQSLWTLNGTPIVTGGQADPLGGTNAYKVEDDTAAGDEGVYEDLVFTGATGTRALRLSIRAGTSTITDWRLRDETAAATRVQLRATWTAGVPSVAVVAGSGTVSTVAGSGSWYESTFTADSVIAANTNRLSLFGASTGNTPVGYTYYYGVNAWNSVYSMNYRSTAGDAQQMGSNLVVDGATASVSNWLRSGDIITIAGVAGTREVTADTSSVANGHAQIPINPPIFTGGSPADNAVVTITGVTLTACILEPPTFPSTSGTSADWGELVVKFSESL